MIASNLQPASREANVEPYRSISGLALTAFLLGLLSPLAIYSVVLLAIPLGGAVAAAAALRRIAARGDELVGRRLALAALILACFFGAWSIVQPVGRSWVIAHQARRFCDGWLQLLAEDKTLEAFEWTLEPATRISPTISLAEFFKINVAARRSRDTYFAMLPIASNAEGSTLQSFRYLGNESTTSLAPGDDLIVERYEIVHEKGGKPIAEIVLLTARRTLAEDSRFVHWQLRQVERDRSGSRKSL